MSFKKCFGVVSMTAMTFGIAFVGCTETVTLPGPTNLTPTEDAEVKVKEDSSVTPGKDSGKDTGKPADDSGPTVTCAPGDVTTFMAKPKPNKAHTDSCTEDQIDKYLTACLGNTATNTTCAPFGANGAAKVCGACLRTDDNAAANGPLISHGGYVVPNVAGCVGIATKDTSPTSCAYKLASREQCSAAACTANCPVTDDASLEALSMCTDTADAAGGGCATFSDAANACADTLVDAGGSASECLAGGGFEAAYGVIARLFCLKAATDGGTDGGGTDAASDANDASDGD